MRWKRKTWLKENSEINRNAQSESLSLIHSLELSKLRCRIDSLSLQNDTDLD